MEIYLAAVIVLLTFAAIDLTVGVSNDAVNFLSSAVGSKAAPLKIILLVASIGIICGVLFSNGMMEVARKGIFNPQMFTMPELMTIFVAVVLSDVMLLDIFTAYSLPTSTTVAIIFDLLGASVAASTYKILSKGDSLNTIGEYLNSEKALMIILGIVLSIIIAFVFGALVQIISRLIFTFNVEKEVKRFGALWGGVALASIVRFILLGGAKGMSFVTPEDIQWLEENSLAVFGITFLVCSVLLQILIWCKVNIFRPIILTGTFALALSFAANDLVNFIGVALAGVSSYAAAAESSDPLNIPMTALLGPANTETWKLLTAGMIMVLTLWFSKRMQPASGRQNDLAKQDEGMELQDATPAARVIVRSVSKLLLAGRTLIPRPLYRVAEGRLDTERAVMQEEASFDLLRASVNLMVASAVVSFATTLKLPLSTTFVIFMVAMGTSFADQAWGRESAVYRVTGVLTVISGWFATALFASIISFTFSMTLNYFGLYAAPFLMAIVGCSLYRSKKTHRERAKNRENEAVFNLKKVKDAHETIAAIFQHTAIFIKEIRNDINETIDALFKEDLYRLKQQSDRTKTVHNWSNIITSNIFKSLRLLESGDNIEWKQYTQSVRCLQSIAEGYVDIVQRSYMHINDHHAGLLEIQKIELHGIMKMFDEILDDAEHMLSQEQAIRYDDVEQKHMELRDAMEHISGMQIDRIRDRSSKTRLSILFYAMLGDMRRISRQNLRLLEIFQALLNEQKNEEEKNKVEPLEA